MNSLNKKFLITNICCLIFSLAIAVVSVISIASVRDELYIGSYRIGTPIEDRETALEVGKALLEIYLGGPLNNPYEEWIFDVEEWPALHWDLEGWSARHWRVFRVIDFYDSVILDEDGNIIGGILGGDMEVIFRKMDGFVIGFR